MLTLGGFKLTKLITNVTKINNELNTSKSAPEQVGQNYVTCGDNSFLTCSWSEPWSLASISVSFVFSVFDPIGLVAPYTVRAQLLLKEIWRNHCQQCYG